MKEVAEVHLSIKSPFFNDFLVEIIIIEEKVSFAVSTFVVVSAREQNQL